MRFYLDEQMPLEATPAFLRRKGHSSRHAVKLGCATRDDDFHYQYARSTKCIFITRDEDFADPHRYPFHKHPGVIVIAVGRGADAAQVIEVLDKILRLFRTAASLHEKKVIAHASYCTLLTEQGQEEIPYLQP
jgi:predicted nuclease of predicted toxin-antitoxin system